VALLGKASPDSHFWKSAWAAADDLARGFFRKAQLLADAPDFFRFQQPFGAL
jgi:hypothetical protein